MLDYPLHFPGGGNSTLPWTSTGMSMAVVLVALTVLLLSCCGAAALFLVACCGSRRRDGVAESGDSRWLPGVGVIDYVPVSNSSGFETHPIRSISVASETFTTVSCLSSGDEPPAKDTYRRRDIDFVFLSSVRVSLILPESPNTTTEETIVAQEVTPSIPSVAAASSSTTPVTVSCHINMNFPPQVSYSAVIPPTGGGGRPRQQLSPSSGWCSRSLPMSPTVVISSKRRRPISLPLSSVSEPVSRSLCFFGSRAALSTVTLPSMAPVTILPLSPSPPLSPPPPPPPSSPPP
ncbi:hypothetical protein Hamer_G011942, partial [Homarus americanus]